MRELFFALLLVNAGFFAWAHWIDSPDAAAVTAPVRENPVPTLALADGGAAAAAAGLRCRTLGPFADATAAGKAAAALRAHGLAPRDRNNDNGGNDGYWVYLADVSDLDAQQRALMRLDHAGIRDAALVSEAGQPRRVSVGIFTDQAHAVRRAEQVRQLGYKPVLDLHQHQSKTHWLDIDLKPDQPEPPLAELPGAAAGATASGAGVAFADCPASNSRG